MSQGLARSSEASPRTDMISASKAKSTLFGAYCYALTDKKAERVAFGCVFYQTANRSNTDSMPASFSSGNLPSPLVVKSS